MTKRLRGSSGGSGPIDQQLTGRTGKSEKKGATDKTKKSDQTRQANDVDELDPRVFAGSSINGVDSPLRNVVDLGIAQLAEKYYGGAQAHPLAMLMSALGPTDKPDDVFSKEARDTARRQFVSIGFDRDKAEKLVNYLSFVISGLYTDPGAKRRARETLIRHEIDKIRAGITDIQKTPYPEREEKLAKVLKDLLTRTDQLEARTKDLADKELPEALKVPVQRIKSAMAAVGIITAQVLPPRA